jgi:large subunit ribosomal protein L23
MKKAYEIIKKPIITEKSAVQMENNKYTFEVEYTANKTEIKQAIEEIFEVKVDKVNVINVRPKKKRALSVKKRLNKFGKSNKVRKAVVTLKEGSIKVY